MSIGKLIVAAICIWIASGARPEGADDPLASLGVKVTAGAAAGYVDDGACAGCHRKQAEPFREVGMSRAFYRPRAENAIETFGGKPFVHEKSGHHMEIVRRDGRLLFRRWQVAADGKPIHLIEQPIDWILGSGHHSRVYLYRTPSGELYQLPLAWYTQTARWAMAPGYDRPDHDNLNRRIRHECMFCHNAYPEIAEDKSGYWRSQTFPAELPEGLGCQRCHGPGANHIRAVLSGKGAGKGAEIATSIVNPGKLDARRRNDVCYECHMQSSVALPSVRRFGRDIYSFRPGTPLADYLFHLDVTETDLPRGERFEINHHPYRLEQSLCFQRSAGRLSCLSCHDPHRKVAPARRAEHYRKVCLDCHAGVKHEPEVAPTDDCTTCHMPARRTQDVIHVVMTDHRIGKQASGKDLLAPLEERDPVLDAVDFLEPKLAPAGALADVYRSAVVLRAGGGASPSALRRLEQALGETRLTEIEPWFDVAMAQLRQRKLAELEKTASLIVERAPSNAQALEWLGVARIANGHAEEGLALIGKSLKLDPARAETHFNLGLLLSTRGRTAEAIPHFERATELRPTLANAWFHLGEAYAASDRPAQAIEAWRRALAVDPRHTRAYASIGKALLAAGQREEALRYWRHGAAVARQPEVIVKLLETVAR